jgi:hypothetical protein
MKYSNKIMSVMASLLLVITLSSCDTGPLTNAVDDFRVIVGLEPINTSSAVMLVDAATGELITSDVQVSFDGPNGGDVIDIYSDPLAQRSISSGILTFGISNDAVPSDESPVEVTLRLEAAGYVTTTKTATLTSEGTNEFTFRMMNKNNLPQGVSNTASSEGQAGSDGAVQSDFTVEGNASSGNGGGVAIDVASGTVFTDANGNPLSGQLTTEMNYFDPDEQEAMLSLPVELEDDEGNPVITAGGSTISITDANGNTATSTGAAKTVAGKVRAGGTSYTVAVPDGFVNPKTNQPVAAGDQVSILIYDSVFSYFSSTQSTITQLAGGKLGVNVQSETVPGLILLMFRISKSAYCGRAQINLTRNGDEGSARVDLAGAGFAAEFILPANTTSHTATINIVSKDYSYRIQAASGVLEGTHNFCEGPLDISLPGFAGANIIDADVEVSLSCKNNGVVSVTDIPGASVAYRKTDAATGTPWKIATALNWTFDDDTNSLTGGNFEVKGVEQGAMYTFKMVYEGDEYSRDVEITGTSTSYTETIDSGICQ